MAGSTKPSSVSPEPSPPTASSFVRDCSQRLCSPYCPQGCSNYFILPPPPPDDDSSSSSSSHISPVMVALISVLAAAFLLLTYYTFSTTYCKQRRRRRHRRRPSEVGFEEFEVIDDHGDDQRRRLHQLVHGSGNQQPPPAGGLDDRFIKSITVFKYRRAEGLVDSAECAVCLTEFKEEESLRLMPNCLHAFHLPCIDTWLKDHSNCPICRAPMAVDPAAVALSAARPPPPMAANVTSNTTTSTTTTVSRHQSSGGSGMESVVVMVPEDQVRGEEHMDRGISSSDCEDPDRRRMMDQTPKRGDVDQ